MTSFELAAAAWERIKTDLAYRGLYDATKIAPGLQRQIDAYQIDAILQALDTSRDWPAVADTYQSEAAE